MRAYLVRLSLHGKHPLLGFPENPIITYSAMNGCNEAEKFPSSGSSRQCAGNVQRPFYPDTHQYVDLA